MSVTSLLPDPSVITLECVRPSADSVTLVVSAFLQRGTCPRCRSPSTRIHSCYARRVADLPWHGVAVRFRSAYPALPLPERPLYTA